jgi:V-type H+-transporting ATPase subunit E
MFALMEKELFVQCRKADVALVEEGAKSSAKEFENQVGFPVIVDIDLDNPLDAQGFLSSEILMLRYFSPGGVVLITQSGKIEYDNTLLERLKLLESTALPKIRDTIFGFVSLFNLMLTV